MTGLDPVGLGALVVWGAIVGLDLASWPQLMLSRPLVAGSIAGLLVGDIAAGLAVGGVLELFALDVLPIGATQYPDFGVAALTGVVLAAGRPVPAMLGMATGLALVIAILSGPLIERVRRANARAASGAAAALAEGNAHVVSALHLGGLRRDLIRSIVLSLVAVVAGLALRPLGLPPGRLALPLLLVAVAGALAAAIRGAVRSSSQGGRFAWVAAGFAAGVLVLLWR
ncbi:MAG: PTS sugar transporter subunit IIC [Gemmatimonadota bacterium]|nr:PTS sugar transporter subunit IIC [Gemmatimonadota bacterium]